MSSVHVPSTQFGWKRKANQRLISRTVFGDNNYEDDTALELSDGDLPRLQAAKRSRMHLLEDCEAKSKRLKEEGNMLAEEERYWEAIQRWDEAIQLTPGSAVLHELKSQALLILSELYPAVESAQKAVDLDPCWALGQQTLGRAQLGLGEVEMALRSFEKAVHLDPLTSEVWEEDLPWARELLLKKKELERIKEEDDRAVNENCKDNDCHSQADANVIHAETEVNQPN